jgi:hypothetical protein
MGMGIPRTGREADRLQQRIDCLARNRDAIRDYLTAIRSAH